LSLFSPYRAVLRTPHACAAFVTSLAGRLCYGIVFLSLTLTLTAGRHDYQLAGLVLALMGLAVVLVSPLRAGLVDRHGPRRALPPMAAGFAATLVAIAVIPPRSDAGDAAIAVLAVTAGACAPPLGVVMRTLWSTLVDDRELRQAAYSLDGVAEELLYVAGPLIAGVIVVVASPAVALLLTAGLMATGTGLFAWSPALRHWPAPIADPASPAPPATAAPAGSDTAPADGGRAIAELALITGAIGLCLGGLPLVIVAFSQARHDPAGLAWIEAALSAGSAFGGLGYGAVTWRVSARRRLVLLVTGLAVTLAPATLSPSLPVLGPLVGLAGVLIAPALATAYLLAADLASPRARTRAGNWVNTGYNAGSSAGEALSGQLIGRIPLAACLPVLAASALLAVMPLVLARVAARETERRTQLRSPLEADPTPRAAGATGKR